MHIFLVSAVMASLALVSLDIANAAQNCMLLAEADGMRECFERTFFTTPKPEAATSASQKSSRPNCPITEYAERFVWIAQIVSSLTYGSARFLLTLFVAIAAGVPTLNVRVDLIERGSAAKQRIFVVVRRRLSAANTRAERHLNCLISDGVKAIVRLLIHFFLPLVLRGCERRHD